MVDRASTAQRTQVTRLAPSPTGALHLGNARTFLVNWALARQNGWSILLRIEDLDGPRVKPGAERDAIETLRWLGIDWDDGPVRQSDDLTPYEDAMDRLTRAGLAYPCALTRREIEAAASAPHAPGPAPGATGAGPHDAARHAPDASDAAGQAAWGRESVFPPSLRPQVTPRPFDGGRDDAGEPTNWRLVCPDHEIRFVDAVAGPVSDTPARTIGDFVLWTKRREPSYQLAVVVDDDRHGVTQVVRGDDLLQSAARQILLRQLLGLPERITYAHLPLVVGPDGRRLAKRHGDTRVDAYRALGVPAERIIGLIASWSGVLPPGRPRAMSAAEFADAARLGTIPRHPITFTEDDHAWLIDAAL